MKAIEPAVSSARRRVAASRPGRSSVRDRLASAASTTVSLLRVCQEAGTATLDDGCVNTGDCEHGLVCQPPDFSASGVVSLGELASVSGLCKEEGQGEQGEPCETAADCCPPENPDDPPLQCIGGFCGFIVVQ